MAATVLDYATMGMCWILLATLLPAIFLLIKRPRHNPSQDAVKAVFLVFIVFVLTLFANTLYLSAPHMSKVGLSTSERSCEDESPDTYVIYPSSIRAGETVEIVLGVVNVIALTNVDMSLEDARTGERLGEASMVVEEGENEAISFTHTMPERDLRILVKALHQDTLSELRTTITIERAGLDTAMILLMGVVIASPVLTLAAKKRKPQEKPLSTFQDSQDRREE